MLALGHKDTGDTAVQIWTLANLFQMNKCACSHPSSKLTEVVPGLWSPFLPFCPCVSLDIRPGWGIWAWTTCQVLSLTWTCFSEQWRLSLCPDSSQRLMGVKNFISDYKSRNCFCIWYKNCIFVSNIKTVLLDTFLYLIQKWYCLGI